MDVIKRSGEVQRYDPHKITGAMRKAFESVNQDCNEEQLSAMLAQVERAMGTRPRTPWGKGRAPLRPYRTRWSAR